MNPFANQYECVRHVRRNHPITNMEYLANRLNDCRRDIECIERLLLETTDDDHCTALLAQGKGLWRQFARILELSATLSFQFSHECMDYESWRFQQLIRIERKATQRKPLYSLELAHAA